MSRSGAHHFDAMLQEANTWLKAVAEQLATDDRQVAYAALRAVLHALRDRIGPENAAHLGAQLPTVIRGVFYEGWRIAARREKERHVGAFLEHVARELATDLDPEAAVRAVFAVVYERIDLGETLKTIRSLPRELRELWPAAALQE
jgi:uncharacterized protein (DUF2267 family)